MTGTGGARWLGVDEMLLLAHLPGSSQSSSHLSSPFAGSPHGCRLQRSCIAAVLADMRPQAGDCPYPQACHRLTQLAVASFWHLTWLGAGLISAPSIRRDPEIWGRRRRLIDFPAGVWQRVTVTSYFTGAVTFLSERGLLACCD